MTQDKRANVKMFLSQLELCVSGLRERNSEKALSDAEVHSAFLRLTEDDEFASMFKQRWSAEYAEQNSAPWVDKPLATIPDLIGCFLITLTEYMGIDD